MRKLVEIKELKHLFYIFLVNLKIKLITLLPSFGVCKLKSFLRLNLVLNPLQDSKSIISKFKIIFFRKVQDEE